MCCLTCCSETPFIAAAIYNVLFSSAILVPIVTTDALGRESRFLVRSFGIMIATLLSQLIIVVPKMYHLIHYGDVKLSFHLNSGSKLPSKHSTEMADYHVTKSPTSTNRTTSGSLPGRTLSPHSESHTLSQDSYIHMNVQQIHNLIL